jgi:voltage-gated potassium channel
VKFLNVWLRAFAHGARDPNVQPLYVAVAGILTTGTIFYSVVEHWSILDALYFSVTTLTTVGLGDFTPETGLGKAFTIIYVLAGVGLLLAFANAVLQEAMRAGRAEQTDGADPPAEDDA